MTRPSIKYTPDQQKVIAILSEKPLTREELLAHFPGKSKQQLSIILRNPRELGKVILNWQGKYEVYSPPLGVKKILGEPQPYSPPPLLESIIWESDSLCK